MKIYKEARIEDHLNLIKDSIEAIELILKAKETCGCKHNQACEECAKQKGVDINKE